MQLRGALLSSSLKNKKKSILRKFLIFLDMEISYIFLKEIFSYISRNRSPKKVLYISWKGLSVISETETLKKLVLGSNFLGSKNGKSHS